MYVCMYGMVPAHDYILAVVVLYIRVCVCVVVLWYVGQCKVILCRRVWYSASVSPPEPSWSTEWYRLVARVYIIIWPRSYMYACCMSYCIYVCMVRVMKGGQHVFAMERLYNMYDNTLAVLFSPVQNHNVWIYLGPSPYLKPDRVNKVKCGLMQVKVRE